MNNSTLISLSSAALLGLFFASCSASARRTVVVQDPVLIEAEPNNSAFNPNGIGGVFPGAYYQITGSIDGPGSYGLDEFDGFAFFVQDTVEIEFVLHAHDPYADLDLYIYDPVFDQYIARFEDIYSPEYGVVTFPYVGEEFHVVVSSYSGDSDYTLEVIAHPLHGSFSASTAPDSPNQDEVKPGKDSGRMDSYLKAPEPEPEPVELRPAKIVQLDRETGALRTVDLLLDGDRVRALRIEQQDARP